MAEIAFTKPDKGTTYQVFSWASVTETDTFKPIKLERALFAYSMQVSGTFGGATVALHGSLDGTNYAALTDASGSAIGLTAAGVASGGDLALWLKPVASGGTSQSLNVSLMASYLR